MKEVKVRFPQCLVLSIGSSCRNSSNTWSHLQKKSLSQIQANSTVKCNLQINSTVGIWITHFAEFRYWNYMPFSNKHYSWDLDNTLCRIQILEFCIFRPAPGCCALQMLVEIVFLMFALLRRTSFWPPSILVTNQAPYDHCQSVLNYLAH